MNYNKDQLGTYKKLGFLLLAHGVIMFGITYALVDSVSHIYANLNRLYMAVLMVAPMAITMVFVMHRMYPLRYINTAIYASSAVIIVLVFILLRTQAGIGNEQFLRAMISHHSSAIVMCERASIDDTEILALCEEIVEAQEEEIAQMQNILQRMR